MVMPMAIEHKAAINSVKPENAAMKVVAFFITRTPSSSRRLPCRKVLSLWRNREYNPPKSSHSSLPESVLPVAHKEAP